MRSSKLWVYSTLILAVIAVAGLIFAFNQYQQVNQLSLQVGQLQSSLDASNKNGAQLESQLAQQTADLKQQSNMIVAEAKPDLPLSVGFRRAVFGGGLVMELRNNSGSMLEVAAVFSSSATDQSQQRNLVLPPNRVMQFGSAQGWAFAPGQRIVFRNTNFRQAEVTVPSRS